MEQWATCDLRPNERHAGEFAGKRTLVELDGTTAKMFQEYARRRLAGTWDGDWNELVSAGAAILGRELVEWHLAGNELEVPAPHRASWRVRLRGWWVALRSPEGVLY